MGEMEPWQQRVVDEQLQLAVKIEALEKFLTTPSQIDRLDTVNQRLLNEQLAAMHTYNNILRNRINRFV